MKLRSNFEPSKCRLSFLHTSPPTPCINFLFCPFLALDSHPNSMNLIILQFVYEYKFIKNSFMQCFFSRYITSILSGQNVFFYGILDILYFSLNLKDHFTHPYKIHTPNMITKVWTFNCDKCLMINYITLCVVTSNAVTSEKISLLYLL